MRYIGSLLLSIFLLNPCFAQEGYSGHYANALSGIKTMKGFSYQSAGEAFVILNGSGFYSFPKSAKEIGIVFNENYPEPYKMLESSKALKKIDIEESLQYVVGRKAGFKVTETYKDLYGMNNLPMLMLAGPHGGGGGIYDMVMAVGPHGGGGGAYMKAYQWKQGEISKENLEQWMQVVGITDQVPLYVVNGFESSAIYEQAGIFEEALGIQIGFSSMDEVSREEFVEVIMKAQKNIQQYYEDNNVVWKNYYHGKDMGYIDSEQLAVTISTPSSWEALESSFGFFDNQQMVSTGETASPSNRAGKIYIILQTGENRAYVIKNIE